MTDKEYETSLEEDVISQEESTVNSDTDILNIEEMPQDTEPNREIEILLSRDESFFSWFTFITEGGGYTHASIALEPNPEFYYSFNFKGLKKEYKTSLLKKPRHMKIYKIRVTEEQYQALNHTLEDMIAHKEAYKYSKLGVMMVLFKLPNLDTGSDEKYFCSEFVTELLKEAGCLPDLQVSPSETTPNILGEALEASGNVTDVTETPGGFGYERALDTVGEKLDAGHAGVINFVADKMEWARDNNFPGFVQNVGGFTMSTTDKVHGAVSTLTDKVRNSPGVIAEKADFILDSTTGQLTEKVLKNPIVDGVARAVLENREEKKVRRLEDDGKKPKR